MANLDLERQQIRHFFIVEDGNGRRIVPLRSTSYSLGRDLRSSIVLHSQSVSRQHALLLRVPISPEDPHQFLFRIVDGNLRGKHSTNGIFINGERCHVHDLRHADFVEFGAKAVNATYYTLTNLSDLEYANLCESENPLALLAEVSDDGATAVSYRRTSPECSETALVRLASFPELMTHPIVELDRSGHIRYLNPAALDQFPDLNALQLQHPLLVGLLPLVEQTQEHNGSTDHPPTLTRTIAYQSFFFEQSITYLAASELIRLVMTDVTARKQAEAELLYRDRLLQAVARGGLCLLTDLEFESALWQTLGLLGAAAQVDRIGLYENHPHPITGELSMSLRYEWTAGGVIPLQGQDLSSNQVYRQRNLEHWHTTLAQGNALQQSIADLACPSRVFLAEAQIQSMLLAPILNGFALWGHLSFQCCHTPRIWSAPEESMLLMAASNISAALQRQQAEEISRYRANHDPLTGLLNRAAFDDLLLATLQMPPPELEDVAICFLDLDHFKDINDRWGHTLGDQLLKAVADRLKKCFLSPHVLARWGGDEFTILLKNLSLDAVQDQAKRILDTLDNPFQIRGGEVYVTASIGVTYLEKNTSDRDAETLIRQADIALYKAKDLGRNTYAIYQRGDSDRGIDLELERDLRHALDRGEFYLLYQPQVNLKTQKIMGLEALIRWAHPDRGCISPSAFIPIAEERGWIVEIGSWVLRTACFQARSWQLAGFTPLILSVNLSLKQFRSAHLVEEVATVLAESQLDPCYLELEITESVAIQDVEYTQTVLEQLSALNIRLSIDDFGTGYSSLNRLQKLPLHTLKIDQSFVQEIYRNPKASHIISAIVSLGRSLNLDLIAEGVELPEQMEFLKSIHCDTAQGFFFHRPLLPEEIAAILRHPE